MKLNRKLLSLPWYLNKMIKSRNENLKDFAERCKKLKKPHAKYKYMYDYFYKVHSAGASDINALAFILKKTYS